MGFFSSIKHSFKKVGKFVSKHVGKGGSLVKSLGKTVKNVFNGAHKDVRQFVTGVGKLANKVVDDQAGVANNLIDSTQDVANNVVHTTGDTVQTAASDLSLPLLGIAAVAALFLLSR